MAERRMFAKTIIDSDAFLDMPISARLLYYDLAMRADDDGFINSPKKIMRMIGCSEDDINILILRKFIIPFDNGVVVIKHWRIHNYIRKDTYNETPYKEQKSLLGYDENKAYKLLENNISQLPVDDTSTQDRLGKVSIGKDSIVVVNKIDKEESDSCVDGLSEIIEFYNNNIGLITPFGLTILEDYLKEFPTEVIIYAMQKAVTGNSRNINYIKGILNNWKKAGIKTLIEAQEESNKFKNKKQPIQETEEQKRQRIEKEAKEMEERLRNAN